MYKIKIVTMFLICGLFLTACGEEEKKTEVMLYQGKQKAEQEEKYKKTTVRKEDYEEKISTTGELEYQNQKAVIIHDSNAYIDKICVKEGQRVKKGDTLAIYHVKVSDTSMKKKKLEVEQAKAEYETSLNGKKNDILEKERLLKNLVSSSEKEIAKLELKKLKSEYNEILKNRKSIQAQEKEYNELETKRKRAVLTSKYTGVAADVTTKGDVAGESVSGDTIMNIRNEDNFVIVAEDGAGMRYNMSVDVGLGRTSDDIAHHIKGKVISTDNLLDMESDGGNEDNGEGTEVEAVDAGAQRIQISKKEREKYDFSKYNIFISGVSMKVEDALVVDAEAVYEEQKDDDVKLFVYIVEKEKLHKRYIVSNYKQEKYYLVNQGLEEGQTLAILDK